ncbi:helix-turn-helix domain-containing protein [Streptomyces bikiniensis]|uniref:helix-turn-helix domain-containing protein n=1 Tax=Streptomyces bikiniensis TaxID=1896 RepID=UPI000689CC62|nr:helix-turn-helix domain-containing protein [Streptomyces bikiniensis]
MAQTTLRNAGAAKDETVPRRWEEVFAEYVAPVRLTAGGPLSGHPAPTPAHLGCLTLLEVEAGPLRVQRTPRLVEAGPSDRIVLALQRAGVATLTQDGRNTALEPGGAAFVDPQRPFSLEQREDFRMLLLSLPSRVLGVPTAGLSRLTGLQIRREEGVAAALGIPFLDRLALVAEQVPPGVGETLAGNSVEWIALLADEALGESGGTGGDSRRHLAQEIRAHIDQNLGDADLTPGRIAEAHHISVRYLHRLFEKEGTTIGRLIQQRRIEECARELVRRERASPTISAVARRWGFQNATHFSRAFKQVLGVSPRQWGLSRLPEAEPLVVGPLVEESSPPRDPGPAGGGPDAGEGSRAARWSSTRSDSVQSYDLHDRAGQG